MEEALRISPETATEVVHRQATLALLRGLDEAAWDRHGVANGKTIGARALGYVIAGHERHHVAALRERYGLGA